MYNAEDVKAFDNLLKEQHNSLLKIMTNAGILEIVAETMLVSLENLIMDFYGEENRNLRNKLMLSPMR